MSKVDEVSESAFLANETGESAIQTLVDSHSAFLRMLRSHVGSNEVAEDILHQGLLRAVENKADLEGHENPVAWFYTVLRNLMIDHFRADGVASRKHQRFLDELVATKADRAFLDSDIGKAICQCMAPLIALLNPQYADVIRKVDFEGQSLEDLATSLGITPGNLSVRLHRARQALKKSLVRACGTCTEHKCLDCTCKGP